MNVVRTYYTSQSSRGWKVSRISSYRVFGLNIGKAIAEQPFIEALKELPPGYPLREAGTVSLDNMMNSTTKSRRMSVAIPVEGVRLDGILDFPALPERENAGLILFANGSGSSRLTPRNQVVASELNRAGFVTLLFDLLTLDEDQMYDNRFDIPLLAKRLRNVTHWLSDLEMMAGLKIGYFGASTGAAAALIAAAELGDQICAVVSRGGRPDLAGHYLRQVTAPTLLLVGEKDEDVLELNRQALGSLRCEKRLVVVPNATHLFDPPETLADVAHESADWFLEHVAEHRVH